VNVLILGATGQLGSALIQCAPSAANVVSLGRASCDLADAAAIERSVRDSAPDVVINAAAYTAVDRAEAESELVYAINDTAVGVIAAACALRDARLVHISTDFVFDGAAGHPYRPDDEPQPLNVYGASKLAGERRLAGQRDLSWRIVRTAWVYAATGRNFVQTMLRLFRERDRVQVVVDQVGTPTSANSLADCVWRAALDNGDSEILHFTDAGVASWYDFAVAIHEEARALRLIGRDVEIVPISSEQFPTAARRPTFSVLDKSKTLARLGITPIHWRVQLREVLKELK
jgi:dTDP-4-dehydrorhamnose reductase